MIGCAAADEWMNVLAWGNLQVLTPCAEYRRVSRSKNARSTLSKRRTKDKMLCIPKMLSEYQHLNHSFIVKPFPLSQLLDETQKWSAAFPSLTLTP